MSAKMEKYKSMAAMKKHEKSEPMSARVREYGKKAAKKTAKRSMVRKKGM